MMWPTKSTGGHYGIQGDHGKAHQRTEKEQGHDPGAAGSAGGCHGPGGEQVGERSLLPRYIHPAPAGGSPGRHHRRAAGQGPAAVPIAGGRGEEGEAQAHRQRAAESAKVGESRLRPAGHGPGHRIPFERPARDRARSGDQPMERALALLPHLHGRDALQVGP